MMKTYEVIDVCNGFELIRIVDVSTGSILDHAVSVPLASRGPFRLVKLLDSSFLKVLEYLILTSDGTPVDTFGPDEAKTAHAAFARHGRVATSLQRVPARNRGSLTRLAAR